MILVVPYVISVVQDPILLEHYGLKPVSVMANILEQIKESMVSFTMTITWTNFYLCHL